MPDFIGCRVPDLILKASEIYYGKEINGYDEACIKATKVIMNLDAVCALYLTHAALSSYTLCYNIESLFYKR